MFKIVKKKNENEFEMSITAFGETRTVKFYKLPNGEAAISDYVFTGRCGRTGKTHWPAYMKVWRVIALDSWRVDFSFYHLGKNSGRIVGWSDKVLWNNKRV